MKPLIIYHGPCTDGWTAAWAVAKAHGGPEHVDLHMANYGQEPPDVAGRDVIIVDFSYPRDVLEEMTLVVDSLLVLDHHKTSSEALDGFPHAVFDMERSGAAMAWDYFHPSVKRPPLVEYVQDRDLWRKDLPHTEEVSAAIALVPHTYGAWEALNEAMQGPGIREVVAEGATVLRYKNQLVRSAVESAGALTLYGTGVTVPAVVCAPEIRSEVGHELLNKHPEAPFSVTFREDQEGWTYSLRSDNYRMDVGKVCAGMKERFGTVKSGGGHRNAAGFVTTEPLHKWAD